VTTNLTGTGIRALVAIALLGSAAAGQQQQNPIVAFVFLRARR
jgi:hypothetical protein